jgi:uncharacterized membrane protein
MTDEKAPSPTSLLEEDNDVWTYRGYHLSKSEFNTAMVHLFRAEVARANVWRQRLDTTTNWAVISTGAVLSFSFAEQSAHHSAVILSTLLVTLFLFIEARRYRYYEVWSTRVRLLEADFFGKMLVEPFRPSDDWARKLSDALANPRFTISYWEALGRRYRRNYMWIYMLLAVSWVLKVGLVPDSVSSFDQFLDRASIGALSGEVVLMIGFFINGLLFSVGMLTRRMRDASGEIFLRDDEFRK